MREATGSCALPDVVILRAKVQTQTVTLSNSPQVSLPGLRALIPLAPSSEDVTTELYRQQLNLPATPSEEPCSASSVRQLCFSVSFYFEIWDHMGFLTSASHQLRSTVSRLNLYAVVTLLLLFGWFCFSLLLFVSSDSILQCVF